MAPLLAPLPAPSGAVPRRAPLPFPPRVTPSRPAAQPRSLEALMDVVVKGRHCTVSDQFRSYVDEKITRLEKLDDRVIRVEVEVSAERNRRQHDQASRGELTLRTKGPVVRAEAAAEDKTAAFDLALDKLMAQLRKSADRKRVHRGSRRPRSLHEAAAELPELPEELAATNGADVHSVAGMEVH